MEPSRLRSSRASVASPTTFFGQVPIIARSSSCLEDAFGNAFAGKYDSVFLPNVVTEERLRAVRARRQARVRVDHEPLGAGMPANGLDTPRRRWHFVQRERFCYGDAYFMPTAVALVGSQRIPLASDMDPSGRHVGLVMGLHKGSGPHRARLPSTCESG